MDITNNDSELRAATRSYNVNDNGNVRTFFDDNYIDFGGIRNLGKKTGAYFKKKDERREQRVDKRQAGKDAKRMGTADKRSSEKILAEAAAASANQPQAKAPKAKSNKNLYIGLGLAVAVVGAFLLFKKKKK